MLTATAPNAAIPIGLRKKPALDAAAEADDEAARGASGNACKTCGGTGDVAGPGCKCEDCGGTGLVMASDSQLIAMDRDSVRSFDRDGRMRVAIANLSKEQIRPYVGREIPGWNDITQTHKLGLEPDKVYNLYCPGEELEKAAATFNGIQLLKKHTPVNADDHKKNDIVGTTGTNAKYVAPFLQNSLVVWTREGIDFIESEDQKELSCGYHYTPVMRSGVFQGQPFDGVMTDLAGNHVTLVEDGRAGDECVVGDNAEALQWAAIERAVMDMTA